MHAESLETRRFSLRRNSRDAPKLNSNHSGLHLVDRILTTLYLLLGMKRLYSQPSKRTLLKSGTFIFLFLFCMIVGLALNLAVTIIFI